jgi:hypothetical protein
LFIIVEIIFQGIFVVSTRKTAEFGADEMKQQELAGLVGVTRLIIMTIEKCKYSQTLKMNFKIAE